MTGARGPAAARAPAGGRRAALTPAERLGRAGARGRGLALALAAAATLAVVSAGACDDEDSSRADLEALAEEVARELERDPAAVYDDASPALRDDMSRRVFVEKAEDLAEVLGAFREVAEVEDIERSGAARGQTARVRATMAYERGEIAGWVSFERAEESWRLLGLSLPVPAALEDDWRESAAARGTSAAPEVAITSARGALAALAGGGGEEARDLASAAAADEMARAEGALGRYREIVRITWSRVDLAGDRADVDAVLAFGEDLASAELRLERAADERDPRWRLEDLRIARASGSGG